MKLTLELELHDQPNPEHFQNFLGWASMLDRRAASELKGPVPSGLPAKPITHEDEDRDPIPTGAQQSTGRGKGRGRGATAEQAAAALEGQAAEPQTGVQIPIQQTNGHDLPPGVAARTSVQQEASPLPPGVAAPPAAIVPQTPPAGATQAAVPQQPAMPNVPAAQPGDAITIADVQASYADVAKRDGPKAFNWLKGEAWGDGTPKDRWLNVNKIPPEQYERVLMELAAL